VQFSESRCFQLNRGQFQANLLGITVLAISGDSGAAACDPWFNANVTSATQGLAVLYPASSPEVTGVGGTELVSDGGYFWNSSNSANGGSALSYIPEVAWNDSDNYGLESSGGGASVSFAKPAWQTGSGVPSDGQRDVPDVAMAASANVNGYIICSNGSCSDGIATAIQNASIGGGTSAATPVLAGIITLLNQYVVSQGFDGVALANGQEGLLGNINPHLYQLAQNTPKVFHDITAGDNIVTCTIGTPDCTTGTFGYRATPGYDQVTGLGSVDACNLVMEWGNPISGISPTTTTLSVAPSVVVSVGTSVTLTVTVAKIQPLKNSCPASGTITFYIQNQTTALFFNGTGTLANGTATYTTSSLPVGAYSIYAGYGGDTNDSSSSSILSPLSLSVTTIGTSTTLSLAPATTVNVGTSVTVTAKVAPAAGAITTPTGTVTLYFQTPQGTLTLEGTGTLVNGIATYTTSSLPVGTYTVTAYYSGDANNAQSSSTLNPLSLSVTPIGTSTTLSLAPATTVNVGETVTLTAQIAHTSGTATPTGTVTFYNQLVLESCGAVCSTVTELQSLGAGTLGANGKASFKTSSLVAGTYSIEASYSGDTNYSPSYSSLIGLTAINPQVGLNSSSLSFGNQRVNTTSAPKTLTLTNTGTTNLALSGIALSGNFAVSSGSTCAKGTALAQGASCTINVTFTPKAKGTRTGTLTFTDNALRSPQKVSLSGVGK